MPASPKKSKSSSQKTKSKSYRAAVGTRVADPEQINDPCQDYINSHATYEQLMDMLESIIRRLRTFNTAGGGGAGGGGAGTSGGRWVQMGLSGDRFWWEPQFEGDQPPAYR